VLHRERRHLVPVSEVSTVDFTEVDRCIQLLERHREHDRQHLIADHAIDAGLQRLGSPNREMVPRLEDRREEGNPLDVIPMGVGEEDVGGDAVPVGGSDQRAAQLANACPRIENDQPIRLRPHLYTWGVATVSNCGGSRRWD
jgi:hypothetical protein